MVKRIRLKPKREKLKEDNGELPAWVKKLYKKQKQQAPETETPKEPPLDKGWESVEEKHGHAYKVFRPHSGQARILQSDARFLAAIAGTGGGKTSLGPVWLMTQIAKHPNSLWMCLAPTYKILARATVPTLVRSFRGTPFEGNYVEGRYDLPCGGVIYCLSSEREEGLEGGQIQGAWLDEAGQMTYRAWIAVQGRLGQLLGRALLTTTPYKINWLKKEFLDRFTRGDKDYFVASWSSIENPSYPREEYERAARTLPSDLFHMRYDAIFTHLEGQIFSEFTIERNVRPCFYNPNKAILVGSDFNVNPMAWVLAHRYGERLDVFDEIWLKNTTTRKTLDYLFGKYKEHLGGFEFYGDATGSARSTNASLSDYQIICLHEGFQKLGRTVHYPKVNPPRADRFAACNAMFRSASGDSKCFIDPTCDNLIADLDGRFFKPGTREPADVDDIGHISDALGYIIYRLFPISSQANVDTGLDQIYTV